MTDRDRAPHQPLSAELAEIVAVVESGRAALESIATQIQRGGDLNHLRSQQSHLRAAILSHRLRLLYRIEEAWPQVLAALKAAE